MEPVLISATVRELKYALLPSAFFTGFNLILLDLYATIDQISEGAALGSSQCNLDLGVQSFPVMVDLFPFGGHHSRGCIAKKSGEASSVLMYSVTLLPEVAEHILLAVQDSLWNVVLGEGLNKLIPSDMLGVLMCIRVAIPPRASCSSELVGCDPDALLVGAGSEVQLLLNLPQPIVGCQGLQVGAVEDGRPELQKPSSLRWKSSGRPPPPLRRFMLSTRAAISCVC